MICTTTTCCFLLLLFFHHRVNCVPAECTGLPDTSDIEGRLQVQLDNAGGGDPSASGSSTVFLHKFYPACTAQGSYSGTYREYSVVVKYTTDVAMNVIRLFNLECQELIAGQMSWEAAGLSQVDSGYQFMTIEPRSNCSGCSASAGNDFNCEGTKNIEQLHVYASIILIIHDTHFEIPFQLTACDPACNGGLMRCTGTGSNDCCAAFEVDGICIPTTTCSETNFVANEQNNFTCGE